MTLDAPATLRRAADPVPGVALLELGGELDIEVSADLRELADAALAEDPRALIVAVEDVTFLDSTVLRELLRLDRRGADQEALVVLAGVCPPLERLLELTSLTGVLTRTPDVSSALAAPRAAA